MEKCMMVSILYFNDIISQINSKTLLSQIMVKETINVELYCQELLNYLIIVYHLKEPCPLPCMVLELLWRFIVFLTWF